MSEIAYNSNVEMLRGEDLGGRILVFLYSIHVKIILFGSWCKRQIVRWTGRLGLLVAVVVVLPLLLIFTAIFTCVVILLARRLKASLDSALAAIEKMSYSDVVDLEKKISGYLIGIRKVSKDKPAGWPLKMFQRGYISMDHSFSAVVAKCQEQYKFKSSDIFTSEEEFLSYQKAFSVFNDIWDYPSTDEDKKEAFEELKNIRK